MLISLKDIENKAATDLDKDTTYYCHCKTGGRAFIAYSILKKLGYKAVQAGGYDELK